MKDRLNQTPPDIFPLKAYRAHPAISPNNLHFIGVDTGTRNLALTVVKLVHNPCTEQRYFEIVEMIYPQIELSNLTIDEQYDYISNLFWNLARKYNIIAVASELLCLTTTPSTKLGGVLYAHSATALIRQICYYNDILFKEIPVTEIKYCATQNGRATKEEVQISIDKMLQYQYSDIVMNNDHIADSIATVYCYLHKYYLKDSIN